MARKRHETGYAYRDKYGVMHITQDEKTADEYGNSIYTFVEFPNEVGYPVLGDGEEIFDYGGEENYIDENKDEGTPVPLKDPRIQEYLVKVRDRVDG